MSRTTGALGLLAIALAAGCAGLPHYEAPPPLDPAKAPQIRVACFNSWLLPVFSKAYGARRRKMTEALAGIRADVVCLQEVWTGRSRRCIDRALPDHTAAPVHGGGLMLLSRFPIQEARFRRFPKVDGLSLPERLAKKGFLETVLNTPQGELRVITTHLALDFDDDGPKAAQVRAILDHLRGARDLPTLLVGDFNMVSEGREYRLVTGAGFSDAALVQGEDPRHTRIGWPRPRNPIEPFYVGDRTITVEGPEGKRSVTYKVVFNPGWRPDYIFVRSGESRPLLIRRYGLAFRGAQAVSDHNLLWADVELRPSGSGR